MKPSIEREIEAVRQLVRDLEARLKNERESLGHREVVSLNRRGEAPAFTPDDYGRVLMARQGGAVWQTITGSGGGGGLDSVEVDNLTISGNGTAASPLSASLLSGTIDARIKNLSGSIDGRFNSLGYLSAVSHDSTLSGDGTSGSPLSAAPTFVAAQTAITSSINGIYSTILAGTSASDAAVYSSLQAGFTASVAGTANRIAKFTAANSVGDSNINDVGGSIEVTGSMTVIGSITGTLDLGIDRNGTVAGTFVVGGTSPNTNKFRVIGSGHKDTIAAEDQASGKTTTMATVAGNNFGTFNTTAGSLDGIGGYFDVNASRSAGSNALRNVGVRARARGGQINYGLWVSEGETRIDDDAVVSGSLTGSGEARFNRNVIISGSLVVGPTITAPAAAENRVHIRTHTLSTACGVLAEHGAATNTAAFFEARDGTGRRIRMQANGTSGGGNTILGNLTAHGLSLYTNNTAQVTIDSGGDVVANNDVRVVGSLTGSGDALFGRSVGIREANTSYQLNIKQGGSLGAIRLEAGAATDYTAIDLYDQADTIKAAFAYAGTNVNVFPLRGKQFIWRNSNVDTVFWNGATQEGVLWVHAGGNVTIATGSDDSGNKLRVDGKSVFSGSLTGTLDATFARNVSVGGDVTASIDLRVGRNANVMGDLRVSGSITGSGDATFGRNVDVTSRLKVYGDTPAVELSRSDGGGGLHIRGPQGTTPSIRLQQTSSPSSAVWDIRLPRAIDEGELSIHDVAQGAQRLLIDPRGKVTIWKDAEVGQNLIVSGSITGSGDVLFRRNLWVRNAITASYVAITGSTGLDNWGYSVLHGTLNVGGDARFNSSLSGTGDAVFGRDLSVGRSLGVTGDCTLGSTTGQTATVTGLLSLTTPNSSIPTVRHGRAGGSVLWGHGHDYQSSAYAFYWFNGSGWTDRLFTIDPTGSVKAYGDAHVVGSITGSGNSRFNGRLGVKTEATATLDVSGTSRFESPKGTDCVVFGSNAKQYAWMPTSADKLQLKQYANIWGSSSSIIWTVDSSTTTVHEGFQVDGLTRLSGTILISTLNLNSTAGADGQIVKNQGGYPIWGPAFGSAELTGTTADLFVQGSITGSGNVHFARRVMCGPIVKDSTVRFMVSGTDRIAAHIYNDPAIAGSPYGLQIQQRGGVSTSGGPRTSYGVSSVVDTGIITGGDTLTNIAGYFESTGGTSNVAISAVGELWLDGRTYVYNDMDVTGTLHVYDSLTSSLDLLVRRGTFTSHVNVNGAFTQGNFSMGGGSFNNLSTPLRMQFGVSHGVEVGSPAASNQPLRVFGPLSTNTDLQVSGSITGSSYAVNTNGTIRPARLYLGRQTFTANGTYTPTVGTKAILVKMVGAGGGGGGGWDGVNGYVGGGGAGGAYFEKYFSSVTSATGSVIVGTGGAGGDNAAGTAGGDTAFAINTVTYIAKGGGGGAFVVGGNGCRGGIGQAGTSTGDVNHDGDPGGEGVYIAATSPAFLGWGGRGGNSPFGVGGYNQPIMAGASAYRGKNPSGFGSGGGGGIDSLGGATHYSGSQGAGGLVIVDEYG